MQFQEKRFTGKSSSATQSHAANTTSSSPPAVAMDATMPSVASATPSPCRNPLSSNDNHASIPVLPFAAIGVTTVVMPPLANSTTLLSHSGTYNNLGTILPRTSAGTAATYRDMSCRQTRQICDLGMRRKPRSNIRRPTGHAEGAAVVRTEVNEEETHRGYSSTSPSTKVIRSR